jgi:NAD(P)-dependent dehydrogenase (short-subunit alcohol dehydrogenase family)
MKNVVITGASTGIGYATTASLINRGYRVFGSVRKEADAARLLNEFGKKFEPLFFDVTDHAKIMQEADRLTQKIGSEGLVGLVNNAGIAVAGPIMHLSLEELRHQMDVNVIGLVATTQAFLPLLGAQKNYSNTPGRILNVSSVAGKFATPFMGAYCGSKHAVEGISDSLRIELQMYGIPVIVIGPGVVKTPIWQKAEEIDLSHLQTTDYAASANRLVKFLDEMSKDGFDQTEFGETMADIFETKNPKVRYALVPKKLQNWTLPRVLPTKLINKVIGKRLGFIK